MVYENHESIQSPQYTNISDESVIKSISDNDLSQIIPQWETPKKHEAAMIIQRNWRKYKQSTIQKICKRKRSSTNPYFLVKIPIISDSSSDFSSDEDDETFHSPEHSSTPLQPCPPDNITPGRVYDVSRALAELGLPSDLNKVQNVSQTLDLLNTTPRRSRRNTVTYDYKTIHNHGFQKKDQ